MAKPWHPLLCIMSNRYARERKWLVVVCITVYCHWSKCTALNQPLVTQGLLHLLIGVFVYHTLTALLLFFLRWRKSTNCSSWSRWEHECRRGKSHENGTVEGKNTILCLHKCVLSVWCDCYNLCTIRNVHVRSPKQQKFCWSIATRVVCVCVSV